MSEHIDSSDANFDKDIAEKDKLVIVDLWADWCGPCKLMDPVLKEFAKDHAANVKLVKLNIDQNQETPAKYSIMNIPTLLLFRDSKEVGRIIGAMSRNQLIKQLNKYMQ
jgi:thioredoxin 1